MQGLHLLAELEGCQASLGLMSHAESARPVLASLVLAQSLTVVGERFHQFAPPPGMALELAGWTGVILLAESHLAIHTWPERQALTFDVFVCNHQSDNRDKARALAQSLLTLWQPRQHRLREVTRQLSALGQPLAAPAEG